MPERKVSAPGQTSHSPRSFPPPSPQTTCLPGSPPPARTSPPGPGEDEREVSCYKSIFISQNPLGLSGGAYSWRPQARAPSSPSDPRAFQSSPKGRGEASNKATAEPGPALLSCQRAGRGPGAAFSATSPPLTSARPPARRLPRQLPVPPESRGLLGSELRADSPRTPAPGPTSAAGKNQSGGRGRAGLPEWLLRPRGQPRRTSVGGLNKGGEGGVCAAHLPLVETDEECARKGTKPLVNLVEFVLIRALMAVTG
uniref:Proline-rich receptor-like protein kinase PERK11 n=1 Tax=Tursiops truncatus TaxID=9739 RepID=A0A6J3PQS6_TURTR|nr:putative proline-rich receptor-like protein kinase PERK11 [Tursiops truncatus]